jgi:hypothetical protein
MQYSQNACYLYFQMCTVFSKIEHIICRLSDCYLFVCFESHEQVFSYLATVIITGDGAANLDLCLALTAFSSEGFLRGTPTAKRDLRF